MNIYTLARKLKAARNEAKKQTALADDLSREIVQRMKQHLKVSHTSTRIVGQRSGVAYSQLVNWFSGPFDHCIPADKVTAIWDAITPIKGQKPCFTYQLKHLPASEWEKDNKTLAREIGCSQELVRHTRRNRKQNSTTTPQQPQ